MEDKRAYLPIGSVVMLKNGNKRLMIFGIIQSEVGNPENEYDYIGVPYPEGNIGTAAQYLFNHSDIEVEVFKGYEDEERAEFIEIIDNFYKNGMNQ